MLAKDVLAKSVLTEDEVTEMAESIIKKCAEEKATPREKRFVVALPFHEEYDVLLSERLWPIALSRARGVKLPARVVVKNAEGVPFAMTFGSVDEMRDAEKFDKWLTLATRRRRKDDDTGVGKVILMKSYEKFYADPKPTAKQK